MKLERREILRAAFAGYACCFAGTLVLAGDKADHGAHGAHGAKAAHAKHWSYEGDTGPEHWGALSPDFRVCQLGLEQTPIDLTSGVKGEAGTLTIDYRTQPLRIINNGHTIQVNSDSGSSITINGTRYDLVQFHFHHQSEHLVDGKAFDLEVHFVHRAASGALAVVGVLFKAGAHNKGLEPIFAQMPKSEGPEVHAAGELNPNALLPASQGYFRYMGSLTTPPCSEGLTWTVFREPVEASREQIRAFADLFPNNARPVQRKNRRFILEAGS